MYVQVGEILKQPGLFRNYYYKGHVPIVQANLADEVEIELRFTNAQSRIVVTGYIKTSVFLTCSRCLEEYVQEMFVPVQEEYIQKESPELAEEPMGWDNLSLFSYENDRINIYELIRQNVLANIPIKPLCSEECEGIPGPWYKDETEDNIDPRLLPLKMIQEKSRS